MRMKKQKKKSRVSSHSNEANFNQIGRQPTYYQYMYQPCFLPILQFLLLIKLTTKIYTHYMHIVLVQLFEQCRVSCVNQITMRQCQVMMWFTKLSRYGANNCTNTFMHIIRLSNIFLWQKRIILLDFVIIPLPTKLRRDIVTLPSVTSL